MIRIKQTKTRRDHSKKTDTEKSILLCDIHAVSISANTHATQLMLHEHGQPAYGTLYKRTPLSQSERQGKTAKWMENSFVV